MNPCLLNVMRQSSKRSNTTTTATAIKPACSHTDTHITPSSSCSQATATATAKSWKAIKIRWLTSFFVYNRKIYKGLNSEHTKRTHATHNERSIITNLHSNNWNVRTIFSLLLLLLTYVITTTGFFCFSFFSRIYSIICVQIVCYLFFFLAHSLASLLKVFDFIDFVYI